VYGNIVGCTVLHGLVSMMISGSPDLTNAVGDDGGLQSRDSVLPVEVLHTAIRTLGDIAPEKFVDWTRDDDNDPDSENWHFTKRPLQRSLGRMMPGYMPDFPILPSCLNLVDDMHTVPDLDFVGRRRLFIKQTCRLFDWMTRHLPLVTDRDIEITLDLIGSCYRQLHLHFEGSFPRRGLPKDKAFYPDEFLCVPVLSVSSIKEGWYNELKRTLGVYTGLIMVPKVTGRDELPLTLVPGKSFLYTADKILTLLERIRVVERVKVYEELVATDRVIELLDQIITRKLKPLYRVTPLRYYTPYDSYTYYLSSGFSPELESLPAFYEN
jgi:hypothetical protein